MVDAYPVRHHSFFELCPGGYGGFLKIQDVKGTTVKVLRGNFAKGYNEIKLSEGDLPVAGVYYYVIETDKYTATRKMILLD